LVIGQILEGRHEDKKKAQPFTVALWGKSLFLIKV